MGVGGAKIGPVMTKAVSKIFVLFKQGFYCANTGTFH